MSRRLFAMPVVALLAALVPAGGSVAQDAPRVDPSLFAGLHWRNVGPFRGGRAVAVSGVAGDGRTYYLGAVGGGVWKTANAGRTWSPLMDSQPVASIGAVAVAPSDTNIVYVGSGEADMRSDIIHGNGMYRSRDAGATWTHIGLDETRQIGRIIVDPKNPNVLLVAALGHAYGPNDMRGVFRSTDGGATWTRTLFHDRDTGAIDLSADPAMHTVYASLWQTRRPPWNTYPPSNGPGSGLYKSLDGGVTWAAVQGGLPSERLGKIGIAVAPSRPARVYAIVDAKAGGLYRSDDAGANWRLVNKDVRLWQRGWYFCHVAVDPKNPDLVYISDTAFYRSSDAGLAFTAIKGSPDGDDFHQLWIDPSDPARMVLGSDQGASVSLDGAQTWSSWFNQPTGQFYHVATDNAFPYRLYGAQQDSGAAVIRSHSDHRGIQERDWRPLSAGGESGYVALDPLEPDAAYGGLVDREELASAQTRSLSPTLGRPGEWRTEWTLPLAFGADRALYAAHQVVFRSTDRGNHWVPVSGDLTRRHAGTPATLDAPTAADADTAEPRGVVYALAPSPLRKNVVWAGTDDGLVHLTMDRARTWRAVTPPGVGAWSHVDGIEASHFDPLAAYVAIDRHRLDDDRPYIYATRDGGRNWRSIAGGLPDGSFVNVVREDPVRRGLLYAGTETGVFVSFDDGAAWQPLRLNMPLVSVRDISVHDGDLAIATHGRAFWILDDIAPLREFAGGVAPAAGRLFAPRVAVRTRAGNDEAEASPPETPVGENPPNGAYLDYVVPPDARGPVRLSIVDGRGTTVRRWSSDDAPRAVSPDEVDFPAYWLLPPATLPATPGMHRFVWDFHTIGRDGPLAPPGRYTVRLAIGGRTLVQPLVLRRDPRVRASDADLVAQAALATQVHALSARVAAAIAAAKDASANGPNAARIVAIIGTPPDNDPANTIGRPQTDTSTLRYDARRLAELEDAVESADSSPTTDEMSAWRLLRAAATRSLAALQTAEGSSR